MEDTKFNKCFVQPWGPRDDAFVGEEPVRQKLKAEGVGFGCEEAMAT